MFTGFAIVFIVFCSWGKKILYKPNHKIKRLLIAATLF